MNHSQKLYLIKYAFAGTKTYTIPKEKISTLKVPENNYSPEPVNNNLSFEERNKRWQDPNAKLSNMPASYTRDANNYKQTYFPTPNTNQSIDPAKLNTYHYPAFKKLYDDMYKETRGFLDLKKDVDPNALTNAQYASPEMGQSTTDLARNYRWNNPNKDILNVSENNRPITSIGDQYINNFSKTPLNQNIFAPGWYNSTSGNMHLPKRLWGTQIGMLEHEGSHAKYEANTMLNYDNKDNFGVAKNPIYGLGSLKDPYTTYSQDEFIPTATSLKRLAAANGVPVTTPEEAKAFTQKLINGYDNRSTLKSITDKNPIANTQAGDDGIDDIRSLNNTLNNPNASREARDQALRALETIINSMPGLSKQISNQQQPIV